MRRASLSKPRQRPILVTGMPRSGTTWVARLLAEAPGVSLTGREPMNPRGRQYGLGGTLDGWARLNDPTPQQSRKLRWAYAGVNPWIYSRYGRHQWVACLPGMRLVVKDPFALLSIPTIYELTHAVTVIVYRHPGAALASYRRMGWQPDVGEVAPIVEALLTSDAPPVVTSPPPTDSDEVVTMGWFWSVLYTIALQDLADAPGSVLVSHAELASGGDAAQQALFDHLNLRWVPSKQKQERKATSSGAVHQESLHNFNRAPDAVAEEWRQGLTSEEISQIETATAQTRAALDRARLPLLNRP